MATSLLCHRQSEQPMTILVGTASWAHKSLLDSRIEFLENGVRRLDGNLALSSAAVPRGVADRTQDSPGEVRSQDLQPAA